MSITTTSSDQIVRALNDAEKRGVSVRVVFNLRVGWAEKHSTPWGCRNRSRLHARELVVADDGVLTGSFNCSHSGESNAENLLEIRSQAFADRCASFVELVHTTYRAARPLTRGGGSRRHVKSG